MAVSALPASTVHASAGLTQQFGGSAVTMVSVNAQRPNEVAAFVDGQLRLTQTGGVIWEQSPIPAVPNVVVYDSVSAGHLFAGTIQGLYETSDYGRSWHLYESQLTSRKIVTSVAVTEGGVFATMYEGAGTPLELVRFDRGGHLLGSSQPGQNLGALSYDTTNHHLYLGTRSGVLASRDDGVSWQDLSHGTGQFTHNIVAKGSKLWQLSADGLYRSTDGGASWNILSDPRHINRTDYGNDMHVQGLAVSNDYAFFGDTSFSYPYRFLVKYDSEAYSILDYKTNDVAAGGSTLWAATDNGLWSSNTLVSSEAHVSRPVIVIPGILGSWPVPASVADHYLWEDLQYWDSSYKTSLVLDPIQHTYDPLMEALQAKGYVRNQTLFPFPYQWRQDNSITARQLQQKINDVKKICGCNKVDLVGHSMGGLVAREYIESNYYGGDVQNLIQIATPNAGSTNAYAEWEAGDLGLSQSLSDIFKGKYFDIEALHAGHITKVQYIRQDVVSAGQLLPIYNYLAGRTYPDGYPRNQFLENLNAVGNVAALKQRVTLYVVGSQDHDTLDALTVSSADTFRELWPHGKILGQTTGPGDNTVLLSSLSSIMPISQTLKGDHGSVVAAAPDFIANTLMTGFTESIQKSAQSLQKYLLVYVKSPVAISIIDPNGKVLNDDGVTIPGGYYTGSYENSQMAIIPEYEAGNYQISLTGTGNGDYGLGVEEIDGTEGVMHSIETAGSTAIGEIHRYKYSTESHALQSLDPMPDAVGLTLNADEVGSKNASRTRSAVPATEGVQLVSDRDDLALEQPQSSLRVDGSRYEGAEPAISSVGTKQADANLIPLGLALVAGIGIILMLWLNSRRNPSSKYLPRS